MAEVLEAAACLRCRNTVWCFFAGASPSFCTGIFDMVLDKSGWFLQPHECVMEAAVPAPRSITCPRCGRTSFHPADVAERYCGACYAFHDTMTQTDIGGC
jgi:hypothetical protein